MTRTAYLTLTLVLTSCADGAPVDPAETKAGAALKAAGYTDIELTGHVDWIGNPCSMDDAWLSSYDFRARASGGALVHGHVCCGLVFRGCTIRF